MLTKEKTDHTKDVPLQPTGGTLLSAESLEQLPDASDTRLETLFAGRTIKADNSIGMYISIAHPSKGFPRATHSRFSQSATRC